MQDPNFDNLPDIKPVLFEHDYCRNGCTSEIEDNKANVFGKKWVQKFDTVGKWTDRLLVTVATGGDWNRIIARETSILRVQCPFLPEQQLRGKAYKKFGIPALMGGIVSRATAIFGGVIPKELLKTSKKNGRTMPKSEKINKLESTAEWRSNNEQQKHFNKLLKKTSREIVNRKENPPGIETVRIETTPRKNSVESEESETPTPDFEFSDTEPPLSIYSKPTQSSFRRDSQLRDSQEKMTIHSAPTQTTTRNFQLLNNLAVINSDVHVDISNDRRVSHSVVPCIVLPICSQIVSPIAIPTQVNTDKMLDVDVNSKLIPREALPSQKRRKRELTSSGSATSSGKSSKDQELSPLFDTVDIDDLTQFPTPGPDDYFQSPQSSTPQTVDDVVLDYSQKGCKNIPGFHAQKESRENLATEIVDRASESSIIKNELKRKRSANGGDTSSSESKENFPVMRSSREENLRSNNTLFNGRSSSLLRPSRLTDTLNLVLRTRQLNLNDSCDKKEKSLSPDCAPPKKKIMRLDSCDRAYITFVTGDCESTSLYPPDNKEILIVDLTEEKDAPSNEECLIVHEVKKNAIAGSSKTLAVTREKSSLKLPTHSTDNIQAAIDNGNGDVHNNKQSVILLDDHEQDSLPSSVPTFATGSNPIVSELLSDRCCEYDQILLIEKSTCPGLDIDSFCESSFMESFRAEEIAISKRIDEILIFLDTEIKAI